MTRTMTARSAATNISRRGKRRFARLDTNGDGKLGFDEYAVTTTTRFKKADADGDGVLVAEEFKATAVKRSDAKACDCKEVLSEL